MKFVDVSERFKGDAAEIALLSTFQFEPDYFEQRLLRCEALAKARRIMVLMDAREWSELRSRDVVARWLNRRYLVVPVHRTSGVFHPKLDLIVTENGGQVICGSNNLTRSGCTSNLELINAIPFDCSEGDPVSKGLAAQAFEFFESAIDHADAAISRIAKEWLSEVVGSYPWLKQWAMPEGATVRLLHSYEGSLWDRLVEEIGSDMPKEFFVISPFYDPNGEMVCRLSKKWPEARIELLVQQGYTNLPIYPIRNLSNVSLTELSVTGRRAHAKLIAWGSEQNSGCLVGSANFTQAAMDARNVEASLLILESSALVEALFDRQISKAPIDVADFEPGSQEEPGDEAAKQPKLGIDSAVLEADGRLTISYAYRARELPSRLSVVIHGPSEKWPRASVQIPVERKAEVAVAIPDGALSDLGGTIMASLVAESGEKRVASLPVWVIQVGKLTFEPGASKQSRSGRIEETGEGLPEYLDELGVRFGVSDVVEYLEHLNIRFQDRSSSFGARRRFRLSRQDPYLSDLAPDWLLESKSRPSALEEAIYGFVDRHEKRCLRRHADRGNVNGLSNFLDVFTTLIRLLRVYLERGVVNRHKLVGRICSYLRIATLGEATETQNFKGYLQSVLSNLGGNKALLGEYCNETNFLAEIRAALLIVQDVRYQPGEIVRVGSAPRRIGDVLPTYRHLVDQAMSTCGLEEPSMESVALALGRYGLFDDEKVAELLAELR